jgi:DNA-binding NtrC family response regulator
MVAAKKRILLVEDTLPLARVYQEYLKNQPYEVIHVDTGKKALAEIARVPPDAMVLDLHLPDMNGLEVLKKVHDQQLPIAAVVVTANGSVNVAVEAMRHGAVDFIVKPFNADRLVVTLRNALERQRLTEIVQTYREEIDRSQYFGFVGSSLAMQAVYRTIDSAAGSKASIFIVGESGTGKEVCAEAIHRKSPRRERPFIALNCAAIPKELMESEIFGHMRGAFTGATSDREGAAAQADGGTLFLDEIGEMPLDLQVKLLRFVQTSTFTKVGGSQLQKVDVRFVCATNRDPLHEVEVGNFREDLYYRLHVIPIHMPPLREREGDVLELAQHFLKLFAKEEGKAFRGFSGDAEAAITAYAWPGNVRQLQNVIRQATVLHDGELVSQPMLMLPHAGAGVRASASAAPSRSGSLAAPTAAPGRIQLRPLAEVEKELIQEALRLTEDNVPRAAALLEISPSTIYRKLQRWEQGLS